MLGATFSGSACTLSGTSQWCSSFESSAKYLQVYKAVLWSSQRSRVEISGGGSMGLALSHRAKGLLQAHKIKMGTAATRACGRASHRIMPKITDTSGVQSI